jgi:hypothetical protein
MAFVLLGCPLKKPGVSDGGADAAPPGDAQALAAETGAGATIANASDVIRYPDETPIANVPATIRWSVADARRQASNTGTLVAALKTGTEVEKIAERQGFFLITFSDPGNASRHEEGWIGEAVFTPEPPHKHVPVKCTAPQVAVLLQMGQEECATQCTADAACPTGDSCSGAGPLSNNGVPGAIVTFCRATGKAGGADAGTPAPAAADGGLPPKPSKPLDVKPENGKCPAGYATCGAVCRMTCKTAADCGFFTAHCQDGYCLGPGALPCAH